MFKLFDAKNGIDRSLKLPDFEANILLVVIPNNLRNDYS